MDAATSAAFERVLAIALAHPLAVLAPPGTEAMVREAVTKGLTDEQARKVRKALDTEKERATALQILSVLQITDADAVLLLTWLLGEVERVLDTLPVEVVTEYVVTRIHRAPEGIKGSGLAVDAKGRAVWCQYDSRDGKRENSYLFVDGKQVAHTSAETMNFLRIGSRLFVSAEFGRCGEIVDKAFNELSDHRFHYCGCGANVAGDFHPLQEVEGSKEAGEYRVDGSTVSKFGVAGIPYDSITLPNGEYVAVVVGNSSTHLVWSGGAKLKAKALGITRRADGAIYAGVDGKIYRIERGALGTRMTEQLAESIDSMATDATGNTWLSTSSPDGLWLWRANGQLEKVHSIPDDKGGGELFRSRVACDGSVVLWGRNDKSGGNRWEVYRVAPKEAAKPDPTPTPTPTPERPATGKIPVVPVTLNYGQNWMLTLTGTFREGESDRLLRNGDSMKDGIDLFWRGDALALRLFIGRIWFTKANVGDGYAIGRESDHWAKSMPVKGLKKGVHTMLIGYNFEEKRVAIEVDGKMVLDFNFRIEKLPPVRRELWLYGFTGSVT